MHHTARSDHGAYDIPLHRLEGFSDAVFAFAVTLLVVSLEVPKSAHDLFGVMRGFVAFGVCFSFLGLFWVEHSRFFKLYPLSDLRTVVLNLMLLFVLLLYVYPLKFIFSILVDEAVWHLPVTAIDTLEQFRKMMVIYGLGYVALNAIFLLLKTNAMRLGRQLGLQATDYIHLSGSVVRSVASVVVGLASILIAALSQDNGLFCGLVYALIAPANHLITRRTRMLQERLGAACH